MKKSILKSVVSVFAAATMLITSANLVLAENDYMSYSNDFSSASGVTVDNRVNGDGRVDDIVMAVENGVLTSTRTRTDKDDGTTRAESGTASIEFGKSFLTGKIQTKFDFKFEGGTNQGILVVFNGYSSKVDAGVGIKKDTAQLLRPSGSSAWLSYNDEGTAWIQDGVEYTATITLDIDSDRFTVNIVNKSNASDTWTKSAIYDHTNSYGFTKGSITGITFRSDRNVDKGTGTMTFDNLSVDAYTESNYEVNSVYRSADGIETNKKVDGYALKGYTLSKLTNFANSNANFITAAYDSEGRMINAVAKPVSEVESTPVNADVEGATVKSFVLDMTNANPLMPVYQYADPETTVRKWDFGEDYTPSATAAGATATKDNGALKIERTAFNANSADWTWTGSEWDEASGTSNLKNAFALGETVRSFKLTFKVKFDKNENEAGQQSIDITFDDDAPISITRTQDGTVGFGHFYASDGWISNFCKLDADVWYDITLDATLANPFKAVWTISRDGAVVASTTKTVWKDRSSGASVINIGSRRGNDIISSSRLETDKTHSSVWYIDDVVVEY